MKNRGVETYERITKANSADVDWDAFKGEYDHGVVIEPDADAAWSDENGDAEGWTDRLTRGKQHRLPVIVGMLRWARESDVIGYSVEKTEVTRRIMEWLDVSRQSAYNYRDALVSEGVLTETPSADPESYLDWYGSGGDESEVQSIGDVAESRYDCVPVWIDTELPEDWDASAYASESSSAVCLVVGGPERV